MVLLPLQVQQVRWDCWRARCSSKALRLAPKPFDPLIPVPSLPSSSLPLPFIVAAAACNSRAWDLWQLVRYRGFPRRGDRNALDHGREINLHIVLRPRLRRRIGAEHSRGVVGGGVVVLPRSHL